MEDGPKRCKMRMGTPNDEGWGPQTEKAATCPGSASGFGHPTKRKPFSTSSCIAWGSPSMQNSMLLLVGRQLADGEQNAPKGAGELV